MPYWSLPKPADLWNKSELQVTLRNYDNLGFDVSTLRGHQLAGLLEGLESGHSLNGIDSYRRTFHHFLDLPPELRQRVYSFIFSYSDNAYHLQQPAVSRASRLLRTESLPIFYSTNRFGVNVERVRGSHRVRQILADLWPTYILKKHLELMRYFEVTLLNDKCRLRIVIDLPSIKGDEGLEIRVWSVTPEKYMTAAYPQTCQQQVEEQMRPVIQRLLEGLGLGTFTTREVQQIALSAPRSVRLEGKNGVVFQL